MKRRIVALLLAALLCSAFVLNASASTFTDMTADWKWAEEYVNDMYNRGIILGYADGTFKPAGNVTNLELMVMCSRMLGIDKDITAVAASDYSSYLTSVLGSDFAWARENLAVCLASGIVTKSELEALYKAGILSAAAEKQILAVYIVRTMQLEDAAKALTSTSLPFKDRASIGSLQRRYVYMLYNKEIVQGDNNGNFNPSSKVSRAVTATMVSRALSYMEENGVKVTLDAYKDYSSVSGNVKSVSGRLLTVENASGVSSFDVSDDAVIYLDGQTSSSMPETGMYVEALKNASGKASLLRAYRPLSVSGKVSALTQSYVSISGLATRLTLDSSSKIYVNGRSVTVNELNIDTENAFASCTYDPNGRVLELSFTDSTSPASGILVSHSSSSVSISTFDGVMLYAPLTGSTEITADGKRVTLDSSLYGSLVTARTDSAGNLVSLAADSSHTAVQGAFRETLLTSIPNMIYIKDTSTNKITGYALSSVSLPVYNKGVQSSLSALTADSGITLVLDKSGAVSSVYSYPASVKTSGKITSITYGANITLRVLTSDGSYADFALNPSDMPSIVLSGAAVGIDSLRAGDSIDVSVKYGRISAIGASRQTANVTGKLTRIVYDINGSTVSVADAAGRETEYVLDRSVVISIAGRSVPLSSISVGSTVKLSVAGSAVTSIYVDATTFAEASGKVIYINSKGYSMLVELAGGAQLPVDLTYDTKLLSANGRAMTLDSLSVYDNIAIDGSYDGIRFIADIITVK